ncbi:PREDICTED: tyrosine-protein kinase PR2 isoform X1 [Papilio xuthus]|uniref:non-specific protein-tyrosine kinase n=1 Tax=Papilio xuthus TaxID=66420 RepID=A0AAJ7EJ56_PAPXU|nr:PREDICTED: tyrosine-protein kinase PR2 isoform X1 [Papilio xuthus]
MEHIGDEQEKLKRFLREADLQQYYMVFRDVLKINKLTQLKYVISGDLNQIGFSKPEQRRYRKQYSRYFPNPYLNKLKQLLTASRRNEPVTLGHGSISIDLQPNPESATVPTKHIISIEDININKELGMGQFGVVQQGTWTTGNQRLQVAIKCLGQERMTSNSSEFLKEAAVMHNIEHPNIVRLHGVVLHLDSLMLVTELAPLRSLLECLREVSLRASFPVSNLCEFAQQICDGMTYLENKRLIHRDLAARNILVFSKYRVKISDFGLSRALGVGKDYYQTNYNVNLKLPVAWCAPECILYLRFTSASDVWAFGVCLWEMFTYGFQPWAAFSGHQILEAIDEPNCQRLERPECCPDEYYSTMLECWAHDPNCRPKFKELMPKLHAIQPIQVQAIADFFEPPDGRRSNFLEYKAGQVITVLGKEDFTQSSMWYGVLPGGTCGVFDPHETEPLVESERALPGSMSPSRNATRTSAISRSDHKRHTYTGKRTIHRSMISSPQGDVKHTGHVGVDGAVFGDIAFLDPAACTSCQVVTQYKPSDDSEQVPLLNPNSPSHLSGAMCMPPYPILKATYTETKHDRDEVDLSYTDKKHKSHKKNKLKSLSEPSTSKGIFSKVKSASLGRYHKNDDVQPVCTCSGSEVHEYHEISDTDTEGTAAELIKYDNFAVPDSPKSCNDFGQSLIDEMEHLFRNLDTRKRDDGIGKHFDFDNARPHTLSKADKKKGGNTGTMKLMSAHDERTLDTAVALANEITTKSMNDLDGDQRAPSSPNDRSKFHFKFPLVSLHQSGAHDAESGKHERRNFSEEAKSVPDLQSTITAESKLAYTSLIEDPMPSTSLISHMEMTHKPATIPKPAPRFKEPRANFLSLQKQLPNNNQPSSSKEAMGQQLHTNHVINELPLPPRSTKPKLIDKPRHIRKYPLKLPNSNPSPEVAPKAINNDQNNQVIIYQNAVTCTMKQRNGQQENGQRTYDQGVDVFDGPSTVNVDTNPFTNTTGQRYPNPFNSPLEATDTEDVCTCDEIQRKYVVKDISEIGYLSQYTKKTDYVSVEDLLEFANQKPCGRQRGVESDEVRIMNKVLKEETTPEECLEALELSDWNVHEAIKIIMVKRSVIAPQVTLEDCMRGLAHTAGDIAKASAAIVAYLTEIRQ